MDEQGLAERLISFETSTEDGIRAAAGFIRGWLESRGIPVADRSHHGLPVLTADVGPADGPCLVLHGHCDVVPGRAEQFHPRVEGDRLIGRGAYDMKGGLAAMMLALRDAADQDRVRVRFVCAPDEESEELDVHATDALIADGLQADFAITGEPTDLRIGVQAKGVLALRVRVHGRAAHGSTPWLGDNAVLKAVDVFRCIQTLPFSRESSELFDRPSINLGRIQGGDALNKVPDECVMDVDVRYLPGQDPEEILTQVRTIGDMEVVRIFHRVPAIVSGEDPYVRALRASLERAIPGNAMSVGRDGASDAVAFLTAGIPAVELGPTGGGHHGPEEWVSIASLSRYRRALVDFVAHIPGAAELAGRASIAPLREVGQDTAA